MRKVAVVNRTSFFNFGSVLQVLGLVKAIESLGYETEVIWESGNLSKKIDLRPKKMFQIGLKLIMHPQFIKGIYKDFRSVKGTQYSELTKNLFHSFVEKHLNRKFFQSREFKTISRSDEYYKFVCGSDQIWVSTTLYPDPLMYLRFAPKEKRVAYAPSIGRSYIPDYNKGIMRRYIQDFPFVSIREIEGANIIKKLINQEVPVVLDPTLLFDKTFWIAYSNPIQERDYILCYFLTEPSITIQNEILRFANGKKIVALKSPFTHIASNYKEFCLPDAGPGEFISYISNADFIFTDSYHGLLFSINFEKDFISVERNYGEFDQSTRQRSILSQLELIHKHNHTGKINKSTIDYTKIKNRLADLRSISFQYLKNALDTPI